MNPRSILFNLKELYGEPSRTTRYKISKQLFRTRMSEDTSMQIYILKIIDLITHLGQLGFELSEDLILQSLSNSFSQFVINYHMTKLNIFLLELLNMLKTAESHFKSERAPLLLVNKKNIVGKKGSKRKLNPKSSIQTRKKVKKVCMDGWYLFSLQ